MDWPLLLECMAMTVGGGLFLYLGPCYLIEWLYYRRQAEQPQAWKTQPERDSPARLRREEVRLGTFNMTWASVVSGIIMYHIRTGGWSMLYFDFDEYGLSYTLISTVFYFMLVDCSLYWGHRALHIRYLYRTIHRVHHRWRTPSPFTSLAVHPVELGTFQFFSLIPMFLFPLHPAGVILILIYQQVVSVLDHSGVRFHSIFPWQAPAAFHDDHHVYFHVNFSQNMGLWDRIFGSWRREDERYGEDRFLVDQEHRSPLLDYAREAVTSRSLARIKPPRKNKATATSGDETEQVAPC